MRLARSWSVVVLVAVAPWRSGGDVDDDLRATTRAGLRLGQIEQTITQTGTAPGCDPAPALRRAFYQFDVQDGRWTGSTFTGTWDRTFPPGSFAGHRREQVTYRVELDPALDEVVGFTLDATLTGHDDRPPGTTSTNKVHIRWRGPALPRDELDGLHPYTFELVTPIGDAQVELTDTYSVSGEDCESRVISNVGVEGGVVVVGFAE